MTRLLITAIGGDVAQCAARALHSVMPNVELFGSDIRLDHAGSLFVAEVFKVPSANDRGYTAALASVCREQRIDAVLPLSEAELTTLYNDRNLGCPIIGPGAEAVKVGGDKLATAKYLENLGWRAPITRDAADLNSWSSFPCIYKLRRGSGSKVVQICRSAEELAFFAARHPNGVAQQLVEGPEITCAIYRTVDAEVRVLQLARRLAGGTTVWAEVVNDPKVDALCRDVAQGLSVTGSINIQLKLTSAGPMVFEINPRLSSTVLMRHKLGFADAQWTVQEFLGETTKYVAPKEGSVVVRVHDAEVLAASC